MERRVERKREDVYDEQRRQRRQRRRESADGKRWGRSNRGYRGVLVRLRDEGDKSVLLRGRCQSTVDEQTRVDWTVRERY